MIHRLDPRHRVAALALIGLLLIAGNCKKAPVAAASTLPVPVVLGPQDIAVARVTPLGSTVVISGSLEPVTTVTVKTQVAGTVTDVHVDRGTPVSAGEVLARIDAEGIKSAELGANASVSAAEANLALAQQKAASSKKLFDAGAIAKLDYQTAQTDVDAANAQLVSAQAQATSAKEQVGRTTITSPITGIVSDRKVSGGEAVAVAAVLFTVVDASLLEMAGEAGVEQAARVRVGAPVAFALAAYPGRSFSGTVARIDPVADSATRQVGIHVRMSNPESRIVGGQFADGRIETGAATTAVTVPASAVVDRTGAQGAVYVLAAGSHVVRRPVTVGARDDATGLIPVTHGVASGDQVIVNPSSDIHDGISVTVATDDAPAPAVTDSAGRGRGGARR